MELELPSLYEEPEQPATETVVGALEFLDVFKIFGSGSSETVALRGLELRVEQGELVAVFGPSGSGKSTMLHLAAGLDDASAGEVRAFGRPLNRLGERALAAYRAREVAIVFQNGNLWTGLSARENVKVALGLAGEPDRTRADEALDAFGLGPRARQRSGSLSGGEQQRVAIAAVAARRAPLVLADEPTAELDEANEQIVLEALARLRDDYGSTVIVVTHSVRVAAFVDRVIELHDGRAR